MPAGRYAPSPTSDLHIGNLRTAVVAFLLARATGRTFHLRVENLDQTRVAAAPDVARRQVSDLGRLGLEWDGPITWQTERIPAYEAALTSLDTYECFCSRREVAAAVQAPNGPDGHRPYPGTCRDLSSLQRNERRLTRNPALRVRGNDACVTVHDRYAGPYAGRVDDFVVRRGDGAFAYNLASVVDDAAIGVDQVCRGDDLLPSAPRQAWLAQRLGHPVPEYAHVGLVTNPAGQRLAKRDGAVSLGDLEPETGAVPVVIAWIGDSLGYAAPGERLTLTELAARFDPARPVPGCVFPTTSYCPVPRLRRSTT